MDINKEICDVENKIIETLNNSNLPISIMRLIVGGILKQIMIEEQKALEVNTDESTDK